MDMPQQTPQKNNTIMIVVAILVVGLAVGAGLGYKFMSKGTGKSTVSNAPVASTTQAPVAGQQPTTPPPSGQSTTTPPPPPPPPSVGFYGKVVKRDGSVVTIQQLLPPTAPGGKLTEGKLYTVTAGDKIPFIHQKKATVVKPGTPPFTPEPGTVNGLNKGLFVYIETTEDIASKTSVSATQIMYSEESPF